ncbi:hypothetical protein PMIN02_006346 [Paraphaeosphaeria minitans]
MAIKYEHNDLCNCLSEGLAGAFQSRAARQLLGPLSGATDAPLLIAQSLKTEFGPWSQWPVYKAGKRCDDAIVRSAAEFWSFLRKPDEIWGRVIHIRSIPPIVTLLLLTTLIPKFDMELIFSEFVSRGGRMSAAGSGQLKEHGLDRLWSYTMKYYYLSLEKESLYEGQESGLLHEKGSGLYICRGTSSINVRVRSKRSRLTDSNQWTCLVLSTWKRYDGHNPDFANHCEVFLWTVGRALSEIRRELRGVAQEISLLAVPSDEFLFNEAYRESLICENTSYSNSKTYFWALQTLRTINDCINSLLSTWERFEVYHLPDLLCGWNYVLSEQESKRHDPGPTSNTVSFLKHIKDKLVKLKELRSLNIERQEEIESLRDGLFNASTVLEARTTVLQG